MEHISFIITHVIHFLIINIYSLEEIEETFIINIFSNSPLLSTLLILLLLLNLLLSQILPFLPFNSASYTTNRTSFTQIVNYTFSQHFISEILIFIEMEFKMPNSLIFLFISLRSELYVLQLFQTSLIFLCNFTSQDLSILHTLQPILRNSRSISYCFSHFILLFFLNILFITLHIFHSHCSSLNDVSLLLQMRSL